MGSDSFSIIVLPNCVQATPDYALLLIVAQASGSPDAER